MSIRVLHVVASWDDRAGSEATALVGLITALAAKGVVSDVLAIDPVRADAVMAPCDVHGLAQTARAVLGADVLHVHGVDRRTSEIVQRILRRADKPYIISPHGGTYPDSYDDAGWVTRTTVAARIRSMLRKAGIVAGLNASEAEHLRSIRGVNDIRVLPCGAGGETTNSGAIADGRPDGEYRYLLFLGPIHPVEGIVPMLGAVAELGHDFRGWKLLLAGPEPGAWRRKLEAAIVRKRASDRVAFVTDPDVAAQRSLLGDASILVAPALRMRCPTSVACAVNAGVPVVASDHGLPPGAGAFVRVCKPDRVALRDVLRPLVTSTEEDLRTLGCRARDAGASLFEWSTHLDAYVDAYDIAGHPTPRSRGVRRSSAAT